MTEDTRWTADNHRIDRPEIYVQEGGEGWVIMEGDRVLERDCFCCGKPFTTERSAKLVCEALYPPVRS